MTPWVMTVTGRKINPFNVQSSEIDIEEMAHGLSNINRFIGNTTVPINVAWHSVWVSRLCGIGVAGLQGLIHDGSEYLLGDMNHWVKNTPDLAPFRGYEDSAQRTVYRAFNCPEEMLPQVRFADTLMVRVEGEFTWGPNWNHVPGYGPLTSGERELVRGWHPLDAVGSKHAFVARYFELKGRVAGDR